MPLVLVFLAGAALALGVGWLGLLAVALLLGALFAAAWRVGLSPAVLVSTWVRLYLRAPRLLWSRDLRAAEEAAGRPVHTATLRGVRLALDAEDPAPLTGAVEATWARLDALVRGIRPGVERIVLLQDHDAFLRYVGGWFGGRVTGAAGLYFRAGPRRVTGSLAAFGQAGREPRALVAHELVHAAAMTLSTRVFMAPWLNEGLADAVALDLFEPHVLLARARLVRRLERAGEALTWKALTGARPGEVVGWAARNDPASLLDRHRFYATASLVVGELLGRGEAGSRCVRDLVLRPHKADAVLEEHLDLDGEALVECALAAARERDPAPTPDEQAHCARVSRSIRERALPHHARPPAVLGLAAFPVEAVEALLEEVATEGDSEDARAARLALELVRTGP